MGLGRRSLTIIGISLAGVTVALAIGIRLRNRGSHDPATAELDRHLDRLRSLPYTMLTSEEVSEDRHDVVSHNPAKTDPGYSLYTVGVAPVVYLIDMDGRRVHKWGYPQEQEGYWHHVVMRANGNLVVINEFNHVLELDWNSNLVWKREMRAHHDLVELPDGTFYVIGVESWMHRGFEVRFPTLEHLSPDGEFIDKWSAHEHFEEIKRKFDRRSFLDTILDSLLTEKSWLEVYSEILERREADVMDDENIEYDHFHMNTVNLLPDTPLGRRDTRFRKGNLLTCFRNVNQIAILDGDTKEVLWTWGEGVLEWPHHPTMVENGNILVFDNGARRKYSRVIEIDPVTLEAQWEYVGDPPESFYSYGKGSAQRLPNGNTLICEGDRGRAFEVTGEGEIVWEWLNPMLRARRRVQIYRMQRLPPELVERLLRREQRDSTQAVPF